MDIVDFATIEQALEKVKEQKKNELEIPVMNASQAAQEIIELFDKPVERQKEMAAKIKLYLDERIAEDIRESKVIKESTRRFIELYNELIDKLHKNLYGEKSVNLHLHKVSHDHISQLIRKHAQQYSQVYDAAAVKND